VTRLTFWFFRQPTAKTPASIFMINTSKNDAVSRKDVPFGVLKTKLYYIALQHIATMSRAAK